MPKTTWTENRETAREVLRTWGMSAATAAGGAVGGAKSLRGNLSRFPFPDISDAVASTWNEAAEAAEAAERAAREADGKLHRLLAAQWEALGGKWMSKPRIRWESEGDGYSQATPAPWLRFCLWGPKHGQGGEWVVEAHVGSDRHPWVLDSRHGADPDALKALAETWLEDAAATLGAAFPG